MATLGNYIAKIGLDNAEFNKEVDATKKKASAFATSFSKLGGMAKSLAPLALGVAGIGGAMATFQKSLRSTQATSDFLDKTMVQLKGTTQAFFASIVSGVPMVEGLASKLGTLAGAIDDMNDANLSYGLQFGKYYNEIQEQINIIKNTDSTVAMKSTAKAKIEDLKGLLKAEQDTMMQYSHSALAALADTYGATERQIDTFLRNINKYQKDASLTDLLTEYKKLQQAADNYNQDANYYNGDPRETLATFKKANQENLAYARMAKEMMDDTRATAVGYAQQIQRADQEWNSITKTIDRAMRGVDKMSDAEKKATLGVLGKMDAEIKDYEDKIKAASKTAIEDGAAAGWEAAKKKIENDKLMLLAEISVGKDKINGKLLATPSTDTLDLVKVKAASEKGKKKVSNTSVAASGVLKTSIKPVADSNSIKGLQDEIGRLNDSFSKATTDKDRLLVQARIDLKQTEIDKINDRIEVAGMSACEKFTKGYDAFVGGSANIVGGINSIASAFANLESVMENPDASEWEVFFAKFQAGLSVVDGINSTIHSLDTMGKMLKILTPLTIAQSVAETTGAAASVTASAAKTTALEVEGAAATKTAIAEFFAAHAWIPFAGVALAGAAVAVMIGKLTGAFEEGGIVGGTSYTGDNVLARVNSGEMILTQAQQRTMFDALNSGHVGNSFNANQQVQTSEVKFTIKGRDLEGILNTNARIRSKS